MDKIEEKKSNLKNKSELVIKDTQTIISTSGEILSARQIKKIPIGKEPAFFKFYLDDMAALLQLNISEKNVFEICARNMTFKNTVLLDKTSKKEIASKLKKGYETVESSIKKLRKANVLLPTGRRGLYCVNPIYAAKGSWADVKALRVEIEYSGDGRKISTRVVGNKIVELEISSENPYFESD